MPVFSSQDLEITGCFPPCGGIIFLGKQEGAFEQVLLETVVNQVVHNCNISDARYAGYYSVCGLALRLRDLYKWEKGLAPWVEDEPSKVLEWIGEREDLWENLTNENFKKIIIKGLSYDAFDTREINREISY